LKKRNLNKEREPSCPAKGLGLPLRAEGHKRRRYDGIAEKGDGTLDAVFNGKMMFMHIDVLSRYI
jgi:hypothetical protein